MGLDAGIEPFLEKDRIGQRRQARGMGQQMAEFHALPVGDAEEIFGHRIVDPDRAGVLIIAVLPPQQGGGGQLLGDVADRVDGILAGRQAGPRLAEAGGEQQFAVGADADRHALDAPGAHEARASAATFACFAAEREDSVRLPSTRCPSTRCAPRRAGHGDRSQRRQRHHADQSTHHAEILAKGGGCRSGPPEGRQVTGARRPPGNRLASIA